MNIGYLGISYYQIFSLPLPSTWLCIPVLYHFISKKPADFSWVSMLWATATFGAMFHLCSTWFEVVTCLLAFSQLNSVQTIGLYQEDFPTSFLEHEDLRVHKFNGFPLKMVGIERATCFFLFIMYVFIYSFIMYFYFIFTTCYLPENERAWINLLLLYRCLRNHVLNWNV